MDISRQSYTVSQQSGLPVEYIYKLQKTLNKTQMETIENKTVDEVAQSYDMEIQDDITFKSFEGGESTPKKLVKK